jgi:hypothetical protein
MRQIGSHLSQSHRQRDGGTTETTKQEEHAAMTTGTKKSDTRQDHKAKKLRLRKETIRDLAATQGGQVKGGIPKATRLGEK